MFGASITRHIKGAASRFAGANQGNIAVIFAIACVPMISFVGAAIDYSRANSARSSMQAALDSTALMLSKDLSSGAITASQITTKAQAYFAALYTNTDAQSISINATYTANSSMGSTIQVNGSGSVTTDFLKVAGFPNINFNTASTTAWGNVRLRVAMALDNTGSMAQDGKIAALRTAASNLIDQLSALAKNPGDVYVSVIPFAKDVNVGSSNYTQTTFATVTTVAATAPAIPGRRRTTTPGPAA
jgi:Flp pilus assembly protein TadG